MSQSTATPTSPSRQAPAIQGAALVVFRGIGQIIFQEHALTGVLFVAGIAAGSLPLAAAIVAGSLIGTATAWLLEFDPKDLDAGIYGFNSALVGIATLFFFQPGAVSLVLPVFGCAVAAVLTNLARTHVPFPTYTAPFIVTTWILFFLAPALGAAAVSAGDPPPPSNVPFTLEAVAHGIGQVMFQATLWSGVLFLAGMAVGDWRHAAWVLAGSVVGMLVVSYHLTAAAQALDPERLVVRPQFDNIALGLYGYNATLAAVALFLWRRSLIPPVLGMLLSVPLTELVPRLGVPALTAPFVLATWIVLALGRLDGLLFREPPPAA